METKLISYAICVQNKQSPLANTSESHYLTCYVIWGLYATEFIFLLQWLPDNKYNLNK